jgi:hypothetical protein
MGLPKVECFAEGFGTLGGGGVDGVGAKAVCASARDATAFFIQFDAIRAPLIVGIRVTQSLLRLVHRVEVGEVGWDRLVARVSRHVFNTASSLVTPRFLLGSEGWASCRTPQRSSRSFLVRLGWA